MYPFHSPVLLGNHFGAYGKAGISISWCPHITSPRQLYIKILFPAPLLSPSGKLKQIWRPHAYGILGCRCLSASLLNLPDLLNLLSFVTISWLYINPPSYICCLHRGIRQNCSSFNLLVCYTLEHIAYLKQAKAQGEFIIVISLHL